MLYFAKCGLCTAACHLYFQVSTAGQHSKKPSTLLSCNRKFLNLPDQVSAIHIEFTEYYFPDNQDFPGNTPRLAPSFISFLKNQLTFHSLCVNSWGFYGCPFLFSFLVFVCLLNFFFSFAFEIVGQSLPGAKCEGKDVLEKNNLPRSILKENCFGQLLGFCSVDLHWSRTLGSSECSAANWV